MPRINITGSQRPTQMYGAEFDAHKKAQQQPSPTDRDARHFDARQRAEQQRDREARRAAERADREEKIRRAREEREGESIVARFNREREALVKRNAADMRRIEDLKFRSEKAYEQAQWKRLGDSFAAFRKTQDIRRRTEMTEDRSRQQDYREQVKMLRQSAQGTMRIERMKRTEERRQAREEETDYRARIAEFRQNAQGAARIARMRAREMAREQKIAALTDPFTYRVANVGRIGSMGQTAIDSGNWLQRYRSRRELNRLDRQFGSDPRMAQAIGAARMRMNVADEGWSPLMRRYGAAAGLMSDMLRNPVIDTLYGAAVSTVGAPLMAAGIGRRLMGLSAPYTDLQRGAYRLGRAGGFDGQGLIDMLHPGVGAGTPDWMKTYGVGPLDVLNTANEYGIAQGNQDQVGQVVRDILGGAFSMGIDRRQAARSAALGSTLGITSGNGLDIYFRKLQTVTSFAVAQGLDRSQSIANVEGLLRQGSSAGGGAGLGGGDQMMSLYMRMASSGMAGARTGELQASLAGGVAGAFANTGYLGNPLQSTALASTLARRGMPKTRKDLQGLLGNAVDLKDITNTPGGARAVENLLAAGRAGNMASAVTWLGQIVAANPQAAMSLMNQSGMLSGLPQDLRDIAKARLLGTTPGAIVAYEAGTNQPAPGMPMPGSYLTPTQGVASALRGMGGTAPHIPLPALVAMSIAESGLNPNATSSKGAYGLMQLMPSTAAEMEKKFGLPPGSSMNPVVNARLGAAYMEQLYGSLPGNMNPQTRFDTALAEYNWGPQHLKEIMAGQLPPETQRYIANVHANMGSAGNLVGSDFNLPYQYNASNAALGQTETEGGKDVFTAAGSHIGDGSGDALLGLAGAIGHASDVVGGFMTALDRAANAADQFAKKLNAGATPYAQHQPGLQGTLNHTIAP